MNITVYTYEVYDTKLKRAYQFKSLKNIVPVFKHTKLHDRQGMIVRIFCYYDLLYEMELDDFLQEQPTLNEIVHRPAQYLT